MQYLNQTALLMYCPTPGSSTMLALPTLSLLMSQTTQVRQTMFDRSLSTHLSTNHLAKLVHPTLQVHRAMKRSKQITKIQQYYVRCKRPIPESRVTDRNIEEKTKKFSSLKNISSASAVSVDPTIQLLLPPDPKSIRETRKARHDLFSAPWSEAHDFFID